MFLHGEHGESTKQTFSPTSINLFLHREHDESAEHCKCRQLQNTFNPQTSVWNQLETDRAMMMQSHGIRTAMENMENMEYMYNMENMENFENM